MSEKQSAPGDTADQTGSDATNGSAPASNAAAETGMPAPIPSGENGADLRSALFDIAPSVLSKASHTPGAHDYGLPARDTHHQDTAHEDKFQLTSLIKALPRPVLAPALDPMPILPPATPLSEPTGPLSDEAFSLALINPVSAAPNPDFSAYPPTEKLPINTTDRDAPSASVRQPELSVPQQPTSATAKRDLPPSLIPQLWSALKTTVKFGAIAFFAWFATVLALIAVFRFVDPPQSMLMLTKRLSGETLLHEWVPLDKVALNLRRAVITSEDAKFCRHWGFDLGEIRSALRSSEGFGRGASTITQQLAKNLFLWPGKSYVRKGLEVPLTLAIEGLWSKRRILEVYLNFAEWGPGVFGAEAASQYYYNKPVADVSEREAALLAISLPNPIARDASDPGPKVVRRAATLQSRMRIQGVSYCALSGSPGRPKLADH